MHAFWLVLAYDLLEDRRIDDVIIKTFFNSLLYKTNRFQVVVRLFSNGLQRTSKCNKNISETLGCASCATFLFLPHFDVIFDLLLNRRTATWNLFVKYVFSIGKPEVYRWKWTYTTGSGNDSINRKSVNWWHVFLHRYPLDSDGRG